MVFMSSDPVIEIIEFMESCGIIEKLANIKRQKEGRLWNLREKMDI